MLGYLFYRSVAHVALYRKPVEEGITCVHIKVSCLFPVDHCWYFNVKIWSSSYTPGAMFGATRAGATYMRLVCGPLQKHAKLLFSASTTNELPCPQQCQAVSSSTRVSPHWPENVHSLTRVVKPLSRVNSQRDDCHRVWLSAPKLV